MIFQAALFALSLATLDGGVADSGPSDAGAPDGGVDAGYDAGPVDAGPPPYAGHSARLTATGCGMVPNDGLSDTAAFMACQATLVAMGGGEIFFPCGIYDISNHQAYSGILLDSNVRLVGESRTCAVLSSIQTGFSDRVVTTFWSDQRTVTDSGLDSITIRGNRTTCAAAIAVGSYQAHGVMLSRVERFDVTNVQIENVWGDGLYLYALVEDVSVPGLRVRDFCRDGMVINGGSATADPTVRNVRVHDLSTTPAADAPFGFDFDVETGVYGLHLTGSDLWVVHLAHVVDSVIDGNTISRGINAGYGDRTTISNNVIGAEAGGRVPLTLDHAGMWTVRDNHFTCSTDPDTAGSNGTCIAINNYYNDDSWSRFNGNTFSCATPTEGCYAASSRQWGGHNVTFRGNKVVGPGFTYGLANFEHGSLTVSDNVIEATTWCLSAGGAGGVGGTLSVHDNTFIGCATGLKTNYPPHAFPVIVRDNIGVWP